MIKYPRDLDKFTDYESLADAMPQIGREYFGGVIRFPRVSVIAVFADLHARMVNNSLQVDRVAIKRAIRQSNWMNCIRVDKRHEEHFFRRCPVQSQQRGYSEERWNPSRYRNVFMNNLNVDALPAFKVAYEGMREWFLRRQRLVSGAKNNGEAG